MSRPLVRLLSTDGLPMYLRPESVTQIFPSTDRITSDGSQPRSLLHVSVPLQSCVAPRCQAWDTQVMVARGTPDDIAEALWPASAVKP